MKNDTTAPNIKQNTQVAPALLNAIAALYESQKNIREFISSIPREGDKAIAESWGNTFEENTGSSLAIVGDLLSMQVLSEAEQAYQIKE